MPDPRVLSSAEVAEKQVWIKSYPESAAKIQALALCASHELLRAEVERLRGLLEKMPCEARCASRQPVLNGAESQEWGVLSAFSCNDDGLTKRGRERFAYLKERLTHMKACNCINSEVTR